MITLLTTDEVATILRCHRSTVQRMAQAGKFPGALAVGNGSRKSWRIPEAALSGFVDGGGDLNQEAESEQKSKPSRSTRGGTPNARGWELYRKFSKG